jgi:hypothetical protein
VPSTGTLRASVTLRRREMTEKTYDEIRDWLDQDWRLIGQGCAARVYVHHSEPNLVTKLASHKDGWIDYARYCMKHPNEHAPRIQTVTEYDSFYVADLERLEEISPYRFNEICVGGYFKSAEPSLRAWADEIRSIPPTALCDFASANTMVRPSTRAIVITDPWFSRRVIT